MDTLLQQAIDKLIRAKIAEAEQEQAQPPREGPKDYVDLPDGTRIHSSTPRKKPS